MNNHYLVSLFLLGFFIASLIVCTASIVFRFLAFRKKEKR